MTGDCRVSARVVSSYKGRCSKAHVLAETLRDPRRHCSPHEPGMAVRAPRRVLTDPGVNEG